MAEAAAATGSKDIAVNAVAKEAETFKEGAADVKICLCGDSAVGKSKLIERFLMEAYTPRQLSTYALTLYRHNAEVNDETVKVDFWDTAGQEQFSSMHPSYYFQADCCILVFDIKRKITYSNLSKWYKELRETCERCPVILVANKIDLNKKITKKKFKFSTKHKIPIIFTSAAEGDNVTRLFKAAIKKAWKYHKNPKKDFMTEVLELLDSSPLDESAAAEAKASDDSKAADEAKSSSK